MSAVATLYVRNVPAELYAEVQAWARRSGRSVNAEVLDVLEREAGARRQLAEWQRRFDALGGEGRLWNGPPWPEDVVRADRDRGQRPPGR